MRRFDELCQLVVNYAPAFFPPGGAIVERKHDGIRALWLGGQLVTRGGVPIWSSAHLWPACAALEAVFGEGMMLDGEYVEPGGFEDTARRFNVGMAEGRPVAGHGALHIFDAVPLKVWEGRHDGAPLTSRKLRLAARMPAAETGLLYVPHRVIGSDEQLRTIAEAAYARDEEGVVVKDGRSLHRAGRGRGWQRLKRSTSLDLPVIGHAPLKADPDLLGALICGHAGKAVRVAVGFSDRDRAILYHDPDRLIGRVAEIGAMEATENGSLRQARFLRWRDDKGAHA